MEFIKKMKKREFVEMSLKAGAAILAAFLAIILMESMIYSIKLNALKTTQTTSTTSSESTIAYCIKDKNDKYFVIYHDPENGTGVNEKGEKIYWASSAILKTKAECEKLNVKEVEFHAPNAFDLTITPSHFIYMSIFIAGVAGFFVWRFIALANTYKKIEQQYEKDGTIELGNM